MLSRPTQRNKETNLTEKIVKHKKIQAALLGLGAATALIATLANAAATAVPVRAKYSSKSTLQTVTAPEEMVSRFIVKPRQGSEKLRRALETEDASPLSQAANTPLKVVRSMSGSAHVIALAQPVPLSEARGIAARLMRDPGVEIAEPDRIMHMATTSPSDPDFLSYQWHYFSPDGTSNKGGANLPAAWAVTKGLASINVAVIDTGYRQHIDLAPVLPGYDFISDAVLARDGNGRDADAKDEGTYGTAADCGTSTAVASDWHGTHVAGTIAALMDNGQGGTGIAPNVRILPVRVLGKCGSGLMSDIIDGMRWAAGIAVPGVPANPNPARVLNLSLGGDGACANSMQSAVTDIVIAGKVIIASAGNGGSTTVGSPANCSGVIAVTAHAIDGDNAYYADIGPEVAISAPGGGCGFVNDRNALCSASNSKGIYSLSNAGTSTATTDSYAIYQGTSMATAHVTGVAALMLSQNTALTPQQIKSYLQSSARPHPANSTCTENSLIGLCGAGLLDAATALSQIANLAPIVSLTKSYQLVLPNTSVELSGLQSTVASGSGATITGYQWVQQTGQPVGAIGGATTATATFSAPATGTYTFMLTVTDSAGRTGTAIATVHVNSPPVLTALAPQTGTPGSTISFNLAATDADGDPVAFHAMSLPAGATLSSDGKFNWQNAGPAGTYTLTYYAYDNDANSATGSVTINLVASTSGAAGSGGGGGGSFNQESLLGLALLTVFLRRRHRQARPAH
jgi:serine protease